MLLFQFWMEGSKVGGGEDGRINNLCNYPNLTAKRCGDRVTLQRAYWYAWDDVSGWPLSTATCLPPPQTPGRARGVDGSVPRR